MAISSAAWPGRMREMPPSRTLLTYFVPSSMMTRPSLPACAACSVPRSSPSGEKVSTASSPMLTTTMLPSASSSMPFGRLSGSPSISTETSPAGVTLKTCQVAGSGGAPWTPGGLGGVDRAVGSDRDVVEAGRVRRPDLALRRARRHVEHAEHRDARSRCRPCRRRGRRRRACRSRWRCRTAGSAPGRRG